jgi:uncharacterized Ntn-hydrolase superfamily protein
MTFQITARCPDTGMFGIAICTAVPCVGAFTNYFEAGIGAICVTGAPDPYIGIRGLQMLSAGKTPLEIKEEVLKGRSDMGKRQFAVIDRFGEPAAFTGPDTVDVRSEIIGKDFIVTANWMVDTTTAETMAKSFESTAGKGFELAERLLIALEKGDATPADKRGRQSASLQVYYLDDFPYRSVRVDAHEHPVQELRRVYEISKKQIFPAIATFSKFPELRDSAIKELGERPSILAKKVEDR